MMLAWLAIRVFSVKVKTLPPAVPASALNRH